MDMFDYIQDMENRRDKVMKGGGQKRIDAQHSRGKLTARERIDLLLDNETFVELNPFIEFRGDTFRSDDAPGEGVVTGYGKIHNRLVFLFAQDFTVFGGALGEMHAQKIAKVMDLAAENGAPIIGLNDSGGARIQEGVLSLDGYGHVFYRNAIYSGVIPQISVIMGPCAGGAVYSPAITDFVFMVEKTSQMFITGPKVIESVTGATINSENLGGAKVHSSVSGNAHFTGKTEEDVLNEVRTLMQFLPSNFEERTPYVSPKQIRPVDERINELLDLVPVDGTKVYDVRKVIKKIVDDEEFMEVQPFFAKNMVIGFGRIQGETVGIVANNPKMMAGGLDINSSDKCSRFIRLCDCFNIPIITFEDVSGFIPGIQQEHGGIIRHGAKILYAYSEATVPKITVIVRKAFGGAYVALNSKAIGADLVFAWPNAEMAVMGPEGAATIIYAKEIKESANPEEKRQQKINEYRQRFANPYIAAAHGLVDDVIDPRDTRKSLIQGLEMLKKKKKHLPKKKHGNMPL
ncbi:acyl-CoA carboxylase subunit beta [Alkalihalobacillus sp. MEB130]|uniref:acyl-CoA carboxylase subunit beta n=1 Tax=Alkalihalobacillus sp. MEB130 TaxID=2976704 RepID=UPI0028DF237F|nr:acyl-CoA carboxylase subunit beta [Alkalihalobacillus sp. MEB130]MDT8859583.1 acyl-CoA carboxylase subunit beta [Alkalihalobacillus sp. MEB130]